MALLGNNLNTNPKEGFNVISACTDTWKETMTAWHNRQEERILKLEQQLIQMNNAIQGSQQCLIKLKEDYHYSFVEYQGANLTHWSFDPDEKETKEIKASYVCAQAFLIADGDVATKGDRRQVYTNMLGDRFYLLEVKEIENLL